LAIEQIFGVAAPPGGHTGLRGPSEISLSHINPDPQNEESPRRESRSFPTL
jgi:hypothetical protein